MTDRLDKLVSQLVAELNKRPIDADSIYIAIESVLEFLVLPENRNDECVKKVDLAIALWLAEYSGNVIPNNIEELLNDIGGIMHDTYQSPEIAQKFSSTPEQLLTRLRAIQR